MKHIEIQTHIRSIADTDGEYKEFNKRIVATNYEVLGVRTPALRKYARQIAAAPTDALSRYLDENPGREAVYEEVLLCGLVIAAAANRRRISLQEAFRRLDALVPRFDSWAHVDMVVSDFKIFNKHRDEVFSHFLPLKTHAGEFTKRTFVILLMDFFMDDTHIERTLDELAGIAQGQYYVDMAIAWALAEALVKHYELALPLLQNNIFSRFVHNKAIQKARESYRVAPDRKEFLNTLKIKSGPGKVD